MLPYPLEFLDNFVGAAVLDGLLDLFRCGVQTAKAYKFPARQWIG